MRPKIVAANWKMNGDSAFVAKLACALNEVKQSSALARCIICPPAIYLNALHGLLNAQVFLGGQNAYYEQSGARTGELSPKMFKDCGASYLIIGHSERRTFFAEDDDLVFAKLKAALDVGLKPILCVGETIDEKNAQTTHQVIERQLANVLDNVTLLADVVVAYEPVWAIGTGKTATADQAQAVHAHIRELVSVRDEEIAAKLPILYGGSVNETNASTLFSMRDIDGGLIGGASLNIQKFLEILKCINYC